MVKIYGTCQSSDAAMAHAAEIAADSPTLRAISFTIGA